MTQVNLKELVGKLNDTCRMALESAAGLCLSRTNYNIEIEHWLAEVRREWSFRSFDRDESLGSRRLTA